MIAGPSRHLAEVRPPEAHQEAASPGEDRIDHFTRLIHLDGDDDDAQRARLLEIADR
jgi:hypothetical protein